ncbi:acyltransferase [Nocardioides mangrovicus]|uniref:acyltransferase n=1 Tax=Nocardioides mangrovicus TaxID=2478913 RepID=UPI0018E0B465|nr:acyltransferase [Nocardioides mangrovicus]
MRELNGPTRVAVGVVFALRRRWYTARYRSLTLGEGVMILGPLRIKHGTRVELGARVRVRGLSVKGGGTVTVGSDTLLNGCWLIAQEQVTIGRECLISDCGITDTDYHNLRPEDRHRPPLSATRAPVEIGDNVWVGLRALLLKGSTVGSDSVVAAGAVVRGSVPPRVVVSGNPADIVKRFG